jgi:uncharacterized damage-inducible protein DinB
MSEIRRIDDQLVRMFEGEAWIGPSVLANLWGVDARTAAARPIPDAHTIWELVLHLTTWLDVPRLRTELRRPVMAAPQENWPAVRDTGEAAWREARERLRQAYLDFRELLAGLDESRLEERAPTKTYSIYVLLHGVVQHLAYHSGQIALLRRAVGR